MNGYRNLCLEFALDVLAHNAITFFKTYIDCLIVHRIVLIKKTLELLSIAYLNLNVNTGLSAYSDNTIQCAFFDTQCKL